ncbi:MAG: hypothetical protein HY257_03135, partial [Chloroflexi bacterium]|nr:hypothetical protein [Chloroflexota bacterium]
MKPLFRFSFLLALLLSACAPIETAPDKINQLDQIAPAHFVDSSPTHGDQFARAPAQVLINFDVALQNNS